MNQNNKINSHKIGFVGGQNVGKTTLIYRMTNNLFLERTSNTIAMEFGQIKGNFLNSTYHLQVFDIAGLKRNHDLTVDFLQQAEAVVLAFDLSDCDNDESLLRDLKYWMQTISKHVNEDVITYIVGCQADKVQMDEKFNEQINLIVQYAKIKQNFYSPSTIFFTSSKTGQGIQELLENILKGFPEFQVNDSKLKPIKSQNERLQNQNQIHTNELQNTQYQKQKWYKKLTNTLTHCQWCQGESD